MKTAGSKIDHVKHRPLFFAFLIFILTISSYSNTLYSPTVLDDDDAFLESSKMYLHDLSLESLAGLANTRFGISRFIPVLTFSLNHYYSGGRIIDYHLTNIAIHLTTFLFFYLFLRKLIFFHQRNHKEDAFRSLPVPFFIALTVGLWALNPVQTNAVTYLVQRMTSLCALFYVAALFFYLKARQENISRNIFIYFFLAGVSALGSFLSKENSATLPIAIIMLESFFVSPGSITIWFRKVPRLYWAILTIIIILALPLAQGFLQNQLNGYSGREFNVWERLMTEARVVVWYISLLLLPLPSRMNLDHDFTISRSLLEPWDTSLSILLIMTLFVSAIKYRKRYPLYSFGILWFFINLVIESTFIPLEIIFEHRLYLPSMGFYLALSTIIATTLVAVRKKINIEEKAILLCIIILLSLMSILTTFRNKTWYSEFTIYKDCYLKSPNKPRTIANMGLAYAKSGDKEKARNLFYEAISKGTRFSEEYVASANNILTSLINENKFEEAMLEGERLYKNIPPNANIIGMPTFLYTLGLAYQKNQKLELALESFKEALRLRNDPTKFSYIYDATLSIAMEISQEKSRKNLNKIKSKNEDILFGLETLFNVAMECRDYNLAMASLAKIKNLSPDKFHELSATIDVITKRNKKSLAISDIVQHKNYITDSRYRMKMKSVSLINKHYFPLRFVARHILTTMKRDYPDDPFVLELHTGSNYNDYLFSPDKITEIDNLIKMHSDFPPLLSLSAKLYLATGDKEKALATIIRLLDIYPAHPHWLYWEQMKTKLHMTNNENGKKHDGTQIGHDPSAGL